MLNLIPLSGNKTLIFTHLRRTEAQNLRKCENFLSLAGKHFDKKLCLVDDQGGVLRGNLLLGAKVGVVYSGNGSLSDKQPQASVQEKNVVCAADFGFGASGDLKFLLAGGLIDEGLFKTFASLFDLKMRNNEPLQVLMPLPLIYHVQKQDPMDVVFGMRGYDEKGYLHLLRFKYHDRRIKGYQVTFNGESVEKVGENGIPQAQLHWFSSLKLLFSSQFFTGIEDPRYLEKAILEETY